MLFLSSRFARCFISLTLVTVLLLPKTLLERFQMVRPAMPEINVFYPRIAGLRWFLLEGQAYADEPFARQILGRDYL